MKRTVYILYGVWDDTVYLESKVLDVRFDIEPLIETLSHITETEAKEFIEMHGYLIKEKDERHFRISNGCGKYAEFWIVESLLDISDMVMKSGFNPVYIGGNDGKKDNSCKGRGQQHSDEAC